MHTANGLCSANGLCAAISGFVVRCLAIRACTTLIFDVRENISRADIGIEGLRKGRYPDDSQGSGSDESLSHKSSFFDVTGSPPVAFPVRRASSFLVLLASTTDVAPTTCGHQSFRNVRLFANAGWNENFSVTGNMQCELQMFECHSSYAGS